MPRAGGMGQGRAWGYTRQQLSVPVTHMAGRQAGMSVETRPWQAWEGQHSVARRHRRQARHVHMGRVMCVELVRHKPAHAGEHV